MLLVASSIGELLQVPSSFIAEHCESPAEALSSNASKNRDIPATRGEQRGDIFVAVIDTRRKEVEAWCAGCPCGFNKRAMHSQSIDGFLHTEIQARKEKLIHHFWGRRVFQRGTVCTPVG